MQNLPKVLIFKICSYVPESYCPILRLVNHKFSTLIKKTKVSLTRVMRIASFQLVKFLHSETDYKSPHYLINLCHQPYSDNKMKCLGYLMPLTDDKTSLCYTRALIANDIKTLEYLDTHKVPKPKIMTMYQWNYDIYRLIKISWGIDLEYICVCPVDDAKYAKNKDEKIFLELKKLALTNNHLEFGVLYPKAHLTAAMIDNLISQTTSIEILKHISNYYPTIYFWLYKKTHHIQLLNQLKLYAQTKTIAFGCWRLLAYDLKFCQWMCENEYMPSKTNWAILTCSPEICQYLKDKGLKVEPNFFEELNSVHCEIQGGNTLTLRIPTSLPHHDGIVTIKKKKLWSTINWMLQNDCRYHPIISELCVASNQINYCQFLIDDGRTLSPKCYLIAATFADIDILNFIYNQKVPFDFDVLELTKCLVKRGSLTCIHWFESRGVQFKQYDKSLIAYLRSRKHNKIISWAVENLNIGPLNSKPLIDIFRTSNFN